MSYSNHRRLALDNALPVPHRMSHARSCAVHVSQKHRVQRGAVLEYVRRVAGVDVSVPHDEGGIRRAIAVLDAIKSTGVPTRSPD